MKTKAKNIVWEALYNCCIHESSWATISLHYTKEGATKAMKDHKAVERKKFNDMYKNTPKKEMKQWGTKFGQHENWCIKECEILD